MLQGTVVHRLELSDKSNRKRARAESVLNGARHDETEEALERVGFHLVVTHTRSCGSLRCGEYLLSVPQDVKKMVCDAARFQMRVRVTKYSIIPSFPRGSRKRKMSESAVGSTEVVLEIEDDGIQVLENLESRHQQTRDFCFLSLEQLFVQESKGSAINNAEAEEKTLFSKKFSIRGTVDSISPLIRSNDVFALMELYDDSSEKPYSCAVVFQGKSSLVCHEAIFPGDKISLYEVKRQRWKVSRETVRDAAMHLKHRVPSYVFVVKDSKQVVWDSQRSSNLFCLVSTPIPLVSLHGQVVYRECIRHGNSNNLHFIEIKKEMHEDAKEGTPSPDHSRHFLFLTYFPMAPALRLSLRPDAVIHAVNIHIIGTSTEVISSTRLGDTHQKCRKLFFYGACLRSTVAVLRMPPARDSENKPDIQATTQNQYLLLDPPQAYQLRTVRRSYFEFACRYSMRRWYDQFTKATTFSMPAFEDVLKAWWNVQSQYTELSTKQPSSSPFLAYFDHACDKDASGAWCVAECEGCHCSSAAHNSNLPGWMSLHQLQNMGFTSMQRRISASLCDWKNILVGDSRAPIPEEAGWTSSIHITGRQLILAVQGKQSLESIQRIDGESLQEIYTGGVFMTGRKSSGTFEPTTINTNREILVSAALADSHCVLPGTVVSKTACKGSSTSDVDAAVFSGFAFGHLDGVVVASFCLGKATTVNACPSVHYLPYHYFGKDEDDNKPFPTCSKLRGSCSLYRAGGLLFVLSVQLKFKNLLLLRTPSRDCDNTGLWDKASNLSSTSVSAQKFFSVRDCLDPEVETPFQESNVLVAQLSRTRFRLKKGKCDGCFLTASHIPIHKTLLQMASDPKTLCTIQSLQVKAIVEDTHLKSRETRECLEKGLRCLNELTVGTIAKDVTNLALARWNIADNHMSCALTGGGWDECLVEQDGESDAVIIQFPGRGARYVDGKGFLRYSCSMSCIQAQFLRLPRPNHATSRHYKHRLLASKLDFLGGFRFYDGMIERRPCRRLPNGSTDGHLRHPFSVAWGELPALPGVDISGIADCSLADLLRLACFDLQNKDSKSFLAPSLVRKISGARLVELSFCKAEAKCTRCFKSLSLPPKEPRIDLVLDQKSNSTMWEDDQPPTFWRRRCLPDGTLEQPNDLVASTETQSKGKSKLRCAQGCPYHCAQVIFECSGLLDDGTGQAKLYADKEAVLTLLSMSPQTISWIEEGVWAKKDGCIAFSSKSAPPSHLSKAIEAANLQYTMRMNKRKDHPNLFRSEQGANDDDSGLEVLKLLDPVDRATYLLYSQCRQSSVVHRQLDYLVRCKPLSDHINHLKHTEIEVVAPKSTGGHLLTQIASTYSLPPLKLSLVDCCVASDVSGNNLDVDTWNKIRALR